MAERLGRSKVRSESIAAVERADKLTDRQIVAKVKEHYGIARGRDLRLGDTPPAASPITRRIRSRQRRRSTHCRPDGARRPARIAFRPLSD